MAYMTFETKQDWKDFQNEMNDVMWGVFAKDAPEGGYWELVYFTKFLSRFLSMKVEDILWVLDKPYKWDEEYRIYKKFQKLVVFETDAETLHSMNIWEFSQIETAMEESNFEEKYFEALLRWS
jgi:hypothetical protein|tara:strand:+ start:1243 stop:1611 length:369 start_codon:yes stop_codon:yes gene_type:complete